MVATCDSDCAGRRRCGLRGPRRFRVPLRLRAMGLLRPSIGARAASGDRREPKEHARLTSSSRHWPSTSRPRTGRRRGRWRGRSDRCSTRAVGRADDAQELALLALGAAGDAGAHRKAPARWRAAAARHTMRPPRWPRPSSRSGCFGFSSAASASAAAPRPLRRPARRSSRGLAAFARRFFAAAASAARLGRPRRPPQPCGLRRGFVLGALGFAAVRVGWRRPRRGASRGRLGGRPLCRGRASASARPRPRRRPGRNGCRSASRSAWPPGGRSGPHDRSPATACARARSRWRSGSPRRCHATHLAGLRALATKTPDPRSTG